VTGTWITAEEATDPSYWARHLSNRAVYSRNLPVAAEPNRSLLEVGPGRVPLLFSILSKQAGQVVLPSLRHPQDQQSDLAFLLNILGRLWLAGASGGLVFYAHEQRHRVPLPTYPFERQRYWIEGRRTQWGEIKLLKVKYH